MAPRNAILVGGNALKLGLFGANCSSGRSYITAPERWDTSWEHNLELAQLADDAGLEAMVPIARWKGYGGETNPNGTSWETITWACGLLAATKRINVFATVHVPLNHPLVAAKQLVTADHIGQGRLGLNIVCGWNDDEFGMFGISKHEHDDRYEQGEEWWAIVRRIWAGEGPFDFDGKYFQLSGVEGSPTPYGGGGTSPIMMNAGSSPTGRAFAARYADLHFDGVRSLDVFSERVAETKRNARAVGRTIQAWTSVGVVCRPTQAEATDFTDYIVRHVDVGAIGYRDVMQDRAKGERQDAEAGTGRPSDGPLERNVLARGSLCAIGEPDFVAEQLARVHRAGFDGIVLNFVDYVRELPYFVQEVLPRLERLGLRSAVRA